MKSKFVKYIGGLSFAYGIFAGFLNMKRAKDAAQKRKEFFESDTDT